MADPSETTEVSREPAGPEGEELLDEEQIAEGANGWA